MLSRRMERITNLKKAAYKTHQKQMINRIKSSTEKSNASIMSIPEIGGTKWGKSRLLEEWEIKKADHLRVKHCE